ncbi:ABC transporter permease (plasmid) [Ensifer sp. PDNC004]|uniref:ABC transporter permease n=1 Tax=unclassified Ensifer TaxID=2633371 RepID=UPI00177B2530|nr:MULTISPECIES: ABC transporter permease [unclassified Ensifer]MBD9650631.1 ABC transporter permease [Ensifer sp. ENS09]QRY70908.1 ABC transporter permease [Ensifer sp. PDNC004]
MLNMLLSQVLDLMTPVLLAAMAGTLCERAGVFNIALEGKMLVGAFAAVAASVAFGSPMVAVLFAVVCTAVFAFPLALGGARFGGDPIVIGIGLNLLAAGLTTYLLSALFGVTGTLVDPAVIALPRFGIGALAGIPVLGAIADGHNLLVYLSWLLVLVLNVYLFRTRWGLRLRGIGEVPSAAAAMGANVNRYQTAIVLLAGALCGLAGAQLALGSVALFAENMTAGRGWIAVVAVMLGRAHPLGIALACFGFGLADAIGLRLQGQGLPNQITDIAPYAITLLAMIGLGLRGAMRKIRNT